MAEEKFQISKRIKEMIIICWLKTLFRNLHISTIITGMIIDGHDYVEIAGQKLECIICGKIEK